MVSEGNARAAAIAEPDSDAASLALAEAFEASDPARAELTRLDVKAREWKRERLLTELHGHHQVPWPPDAEAVFERAAALRAQHVDRWRAEIAACDHGTPAWGFELGCWCTLWADTQRFVQHGAAILATQATTAIRLVDTGQIACALREPALRRLSSLAIDSREPIEPLLAANQFSRCERLDLGDASAFDLDKLLAIPWVRGLSAFLGLPRDLEDLAESTATGIRVWRSRHGAALEQKWGDLPFLHDTIERRASYHTRAFLEAWLASHGVATSRIEFAGTYRSTEVTCGDGTYAAITAILERAGYHEGSQPRGYSVARDGAPGWGGWMFWVGGYEFSDAPWIDEVERLMAR